MVEKKNAERRGNQNNNKNRGRDNNRRNDNRRRNGQNQSHRPNRKQAPMSFILTNLELRYRGEREHIYGDDSRYKYLLGIKKDTGEIAPVFSMRQVEKYQTEWTTTQLIEKGDIIITVLVDFQRRPIEFRHCRLADFIRDRKTGEITFHKIEVLESFSADEKDEFFKKMAELYHPFSIDCGECYDLKIALTIGNNTALDEKTDRPMPFHVELRWTGQTDTILNENKKKSIKRFDTQYGGILDNLKCHLKPYFYDAEYEGLNDFVNDALIRSDKQVWDVLRFRTKPVVVDKCPPITGKPDKIYNGPLDVFDIKSERDGNTVLRFHLHLYRMNFVDLEIWKIRDKSISK